MLCSSSRVDGKGFRLQREAQKLATDAGLRCSSWVGHAHRACPSCWRSHTKWPKNVKVRRNRGNMNNAQQASHCFPRLNQICTAARAMCTLSPGSRTGLMVPGQRREDRGGGSAGMGEVGKRDEEVFGLEKTHAHCKHASNYLWRTRSSPGLPALPAYKQQRAYLLERGRFPSWCWWRAGQRRD